jgi:dihydropteroate synthase
MLIFGVVNCSPDSLNTDSYVADGAAAARRIEHLLADGADAVDIGGQGSTDVAELSDGTTEWARVEPALQAAVARGVDVSIDTWRVDVAEQALAAGATTLNAANGMQDDAFWAVAADHGAAVVLPFMNGPNPLELTHVEGDPIDRMLEYFADRLAVAQSYGVAKRCLLDPGTGFGPHGWPWEERYAYQKHVYSNLHRLRTLDLPLYIPLPWRDTPQHEELLELALAQRPEYGRAHYPRHVREVEARVTG